MNLINPDNCPICKSKMKRVNTSNKDIVMLQCSNECFYYDHFSGKVSEANVNIFDKSFYFSDVLPYEITVRIKEEIEYWKENDRYLIEILSNK